MKKKIFFVTRYSVINKGLSGTKLAYDAKSLDEYKDNLMRSDRLDYRFGVFCDVCLKSVCAQDTSNVDIHYLVITSDQLPSKHVDMLQQVIKSAAMTSGVKFGLAAVESGLKSGTNTIPVYGNLNKAIDSYVAENLESDSVFATVRLDDDDAVSSSFCLNLSEKLAKEYAGAVVSYALGYQAYYDSKTGSFSDVRDLNYPKIALGLSHINYYKEGSFKDRRVHIYRLGSHTKIDMHNVVVLDSGQHMYLRTLSGFNDSGEVSYHKFLPSSYGDCPDVMGFDFLSLSGAMRANGWNEFSKDSLEKHLINSMRRRAAQKAENLKG